MKSKFVNPSLHPIYGELLTGWADEIAKSINKLDWTKILPKIYLPPLGYEEELRNSIFQLARGGWYLHNDMSIRLINEVAKEISQNKFSTANKYMTWYFEDKYKGIKSIIKKEFRIRYKIINNAFKAHERGEYNMSVPLLLIQADGICYESARVSIFSKRNKEPKLADVIKGLGAGVYTFAMLSPISRNIPLFANEDERKKPDYPKGSLNRHLVLHGESIDYGTRVNSFKTISLLAYLSLIQEELLKIKAAQPAAAADLAKAQRENA